MDGTAPDPAPATEPPPASTPAEVPAPAPPELPEPTRPVLRAVEPPVERSIRDEARARRASTPAKEKPPSRVEKERAARKARKEASTPATSTELVVPAVPAPRKESAELRSERWGKERARIGRERAGWTNVLQATLTPMLSMGAQIVGGMPISETYMQVPVLMPDGSGGTWYGTTDAGLSVVIGQTLATVAPGGDQLEHPLAVPVVALLTVSLQLLQIVFLKRIVGKTDAEIVEITRKTMEEARKLEEEARKAEGLT